MKVYCTDDNFVEIQLISLCSIGPFWYSRDRLQEKGISQTWNVSIACVFINFVFLWFHSVKKKKKRPFVALQWTGAVMRRAVANSPAPYPRDLGGPTHVARMLREQCAACVHGTRRARACVRDPWALFACHSRGCFRCESHHASVKRTGKKKRWTYAFRFSEAYPWATLHILKMW